MKHLKFILLIIIIINIFGTISYSQEIKATVFVNTQKLAFEALPSVSTMAQDIQNYINSQKFTEIKWEGEPINVDITIVLSGGTRNIYSAEMIVVSRRKLDAPKGSDGGESVTMKIRESTWTFEYNMGANFTFNLLRYDPVVSMIDFYMLLAIGMDQDSYGELDGTIPFERAKQIVQLAASKDVDGFKSYSQPGEFTKFNLITDLTDMRYYDFRKIIFSYYVDGMDKLAADREKALTELEDVIARLASFKKNKMVGPSVFLQLFFDTKGQEIATLFNGYANKDVFKNLMFLDPSSSMIYQDSRDGKYGR